VPCLLLHGDRLLDEALPDAAKLEDAERAALRTFYAELGGPKLRMVIPETGPWPHLATPHRLFQRCLAGWLERLPE